MGLDDIWNEQDKKMFDKLQGLINRCKAQIRDIEAAELTEASFKRRESLNDTISILQYCWNRSNTYIEALGTEHNWTIDKETELAQTKLELIRMKNNNAFLLKLCTKLDGKRIIVPQPERKPTRCCGRCDGVNDLCYTDQMCDVHGVQGCYTCWPDPPVDNF